MSPFRLIIIGVLLYVFIQLLRRGWGKKAAPPAAPDRAQDTLVQDPVCQTYIPKRQAIRLMHNDRLHFFCSENCCQKFLQDPHSKP